MSDSSKPDLAAIAEDFRLNPVADDAPVEDPNDEPPNDKDADTATGRWKRTTRLMVNDNLRTNLGGNGSA